MTTLSKVSTGSTVSTSSTSVAPPKTLLVGLDAACWEYLDPLLAAGRLPNLGGLIARGAHGRLRSVMPPITPAAWSSIITGVNPGKHGIYEWVQRQPDSYETRPISAQQQMGNPFWRRLNAANIRAGIVNIPLTHPVSPVDGFLLCGFSAPGSSRDLTYPPELLAEIETEFGHYQPDVEKQQRDHTSLKVYQAERDFQARLVRITARLARQREVHVLVINLMLLDHSNHLMPDWKIVEQAMLDLDEDLGYLLTEFAPDNTLVISDHGSRRVKGVFLLSAWLADQGFLRRAPRPAAKRSETVNWLLTQWQRANQPGSETSLAGRVQRRLLRESLLRLPAALNRGILRSLEDTVPLAEVQINSIDRILPAETQVYPPGGHRGNLSANLAGREPNGIVRAAEKDALLERVRGGLLSVRDPETGEPVFSEIHPAAEIYTGPYTSLAPDLTGDYYASNWSVATILPGLTARPWRYFLTSERWYGDHRRDGIYVFAGRDICPHGERGLASLLDIPATLLYLYGIPQPEDWDGRPLQEHIRPEIVAQRPLQYQPGDARPALESASGYSDEGEKELLERLSDLGYLDG